MNHYAGVLDGLAIGIPEHDKVETAKLLRRGVLLVYGREAKGHDQQQADKNSEWQLQSLPHGLP
jgi:hypothetical protein